MMFSLRLEESLQVRILDYYECLKKSEYIVGNQSIKILAPSLQEKIADHQLNKILDKVPLLNNSSKDSDKRLAMMFSKFTKI